MNKILIHNMTFKGIHVVPGVINYDQRGLVFAGKGDVVVTNNSIEPEYIKYLQDLKFPVTEIEFFSPPENRNPTWNSIFTHPELSQKLLNLKRTKKEYIIDVYIPSEYDGKLSQKFNFRHCNNYKLSQLYGTKSGFRKFAKAAKLLITDGFENLKTPEEVLNSLNKVFEKGYKKAVIKVDDGISGYGNLVINSTDFPHLLQLSPGEFFEKYLKKIRWDVIGRGVVEGWVENVINSSSILILVDKQKSKVVCFQDQLLEIISKPASICATVKVYDYFNCPAVEAN